MPNDMVLQLPAKSFILIVLIMLLGFIPEVFLKKDSALYCHQCVAFSCTNELTLCESAHEFIRSRLPAFYHIDGELPKCPDPSAKDEWKQMKSSFPSSSPCKQIGDGEATCTLGRFRVVTHITESNINVSSHGTVLGCARRELLARVRDTLFERPNKKEETFHDLRKCHSDQITSTVRNSLQHYFEVEHCSVLSDMCHEQDFCIDSDLSEVRSFKEVEYNSSIPISTFIWIAVVVGVVVAIVSVMGIRYG